MTSKRLFRLAGSALLAATVGRSAAAQDTTSRPGVSVRLSYGAGVRPGLIVLPVTGAGGDSIRAILQRDFDYGDRITVVTGPAADSPVSAGRVNYDLAAKLGALAVLQATVTPTGALHVALHDVARKTVLVVRDYPLVGAAPSADWRRSVHEAADDVERVVTGVRGISATRVAFVRDRRVWVVDADGENLRAVTDRQEGAMSPAWHPGGQAIVYGTLNDRGDQRIVARELGGGSRVLASGGVVNSAPTVSPDGATVVYAHGEESGVDLYTVPWGGGAARRLTVGRGTLNTSPAFAPDGRRIAFTTGRLGHPEVYITDADGTNAELLTSFDSGEQSYRSNPDWSPDGRLVAYQSRVGGEFQVHTISLRDKAVRRLTSEGRNEDPTWAPDSRHLVVASTRTGTQQLFVIDVETGRARQLTQGGGGARMAAWSPSSGRAP